MSAVPLSVRRPVSLFLLLVVAGSGILALSILSLPLLLALLMILFDSTTQGLLVLVGSIANWFRTVLPGGDALPAYRALSLDPGSIALVALGRMLPCLAGLLLPIFWRHRAAFALSALCFASCCVVAGRLVEMVLLPGIAAAALLCLVPVDVRTHRAP